MTHIHIPPHTSPNCVINSHTQRIECEYLTTMHACRSLSLTHTCMHTHTHTLSLSLCSQWSPPSILNIFWIVAATTEYFPNFCGWLNWRLWVCSPSLIFFLPLIPSSFSFGHMSLPCCIYIYTSVSPSVPSQLLFLSFIFSFSLFTFTWSSSHPPFSASLLLGICLFVLTTAVCFLSVCVNFF